MTTPLRRPRFNLPHPTWPARLIDFFFAFNQRAGRTRLLIRDAFFIPLWVGLAFGVHPYVNFFMDLGYVFAPPRGTMLMPHLENFISQLFGRFFAPDVFTTLLVLVIVFRIALRAAASYLQDIFELENTQAAEIFLRQAAFSIPAYATIHIENGAVRREDRISPVILIGGPGRVQVHLENSAVFEQPNGASTLVGPTGTLPESVYILRPFERLRTVIDLREKVVPIDCIESRTKDGIPVKISGIRLQYSIARDESAFTLTQPYSYTSNAFNYLVYKQKRNRNGGVLQANIEDLIQTELGDFISTFTLSELLAAIGQPEINQRIQQDGNLTPDPNNPADPPKPPRFVPRTAISGRFFQNGDKSFIRKALERGLRLRWIDVGTWIIPVGDIEKKYQEAWNLTQDNANRSSSWNLNELYRQTWLSEITRLIQDNPLVAFRLNYEKYSEQNNGSAAINFEMLKEYDGIIMNAIDDYNSKNEAIPPELSHTQTMLRSYLFSKKSSTFSGSKNSSQS